MAGSSQSTLGRGVYSYPWIATCTWREYVIAVVRQHGRNLGARYGLLPLWRSGNPARWSYIDELQAMESDWAHYQRLAAMPQTSVNRVAGVLAPKTERWLGYVARAAYSQTLGSNRLWRNGVSNVLSQIRASGPMARTPPQQVVKWCRAMRKRSGRAGVPDMAMARITRLLTASRPDMFFPCTGANQDRIGCVLGQSAPRDFREYAALWDQVRAYPWARATPKLVYSRRYSPPPHQPCPPKPVGLYRQIARARMAFLDVLLYDP